MTDFFNWIASAIGPWVARGLSSLGIGAIAYTGMSTLGRSLIGAAQSAFGAVTGSVLQFLLLAGAAEVFGILAGALMVRIYLYAFKRLGFLAQ